MNGKKGMGAGALVGIILAVLVIGVTGSYFLFAPGGNTDVPSSSSGTDTPPTSTSCSLDVTPSATFDAIPMGQSSLALQASATHRVFVKHQGSDIWTDKGRYAEGATMSFEPGDEYRVYLMENSTGADGGYYTTEVNGIFPCARTHTIQGHVARLDAGPSVTVKNSDDQAQSATANAQAIGAGQSKRIKIKLAANQYDFVGNPNSDGNNIICFNVNKTVFERPDVANFGVASQPTNTPSTHCSNCDIFYCEEFPKIEQNTEEEVAVTFTAKASQNPTLAHNSTFYVFDSDIDLDAVDLSRIDGVEDEQGNDLGYTTTAYAATGTIYFT